MEITRLGFSPKNFYIFQKRKNKKLFQTTHLSLSYLVIIDINKFIEKCAQQQKTIIINEEFLFFFNIIFILNR